MRGDGGGAVRSDSLPSESLPTNAQLGGCGKMTDGVALRQEPSSPSHALSQPSLLRRSGSQADDERLQPSQSQRPLSSSRTRTHRQRGGLDKARQMQHCGRRTDTDEEDQRGPSSAMPGQGVCETRSSDADSVQVGGLYCNCRLRFVVSDVIYQKESQFPFCWPSHSKSRSII